MDLRMQSDGPAGPGFLRTAALMLILAAHTVLAFTVPQPSHFSLDEVVYHQMVAALDQGIWPEVWTGYDEFPSGELITVLHRVRDGKLVPQYPYLYPVLAWPFFKLAGYRGLFALNALALVGVAALCFELARRLYGNAKLAADAVILLLLGTFIWQYGHAAWPHATSTLFAVGAVLLAVTAAQEPNRGRATALSAAAGFVLGFGVGIRLDTIFVLPALTIPFLLTAPVRWREAVATVLGTVPGLLVLSFTNYAKFGNPSPFSYGTEGSIVELANRAPPAIAGLAVLSVLWIVTRPGVAARLKRAPFLWVGGLLLAAAALLLFPPLQKLAFRFANGTWQLLVDFRIRDPEILEGGLWRGPLGSMVYSGWVKKSLLQNLPWLPAGMLAAALALRSWRTATAHQIAILSVAGYFGFYAYFAWHGGMSFNLRYFVPFLPIIAIYGACGAHHLAEGVSPRALHFAFLLGIAGLIAGAAALHRVSTLEAQEPWILNTPLWLSGGLVAAILASTAKLPARKHIRGIAVSILALCFSWSPVISISYDFVSATTQRNIFASMAAKAAPYVEPNSIVFASYVEPYFTLIDREGIRIAGVGADDFADFRKLADYHLAAGRPVYAAFDRQAWQTAHGRGYLNGLRATYLTIIREDILARLSRTAGK
jgi:hypothetical protein